MASNGNDIVMNSQSDEQEESSEAFDKELQQMKSIVKSMSAVQRAVAIEALQNLTADSECDGLSIQTSSNGADLTQNNEVNIQIQRKGKRKADAQGKSTESKLKITGSKNDMEKHGNSLLNDEEESTNDCALGCADKTPQFCSKIKSQRGKRMADVSYEDNLIPDFHGEPAADGNHEVKMELKIYPVRGSKNGRRLVRVVHDEVQREKRQKNTVVDNEYMLALQDGTWQCKECKKILRSKSHLLVHTRIHSGEKPFQCNLCNRSFSVASNYQRHLRLSHKDGKLWKCTFCDHTTETQDDLLSHMTETHPASSDSSEGGAMKKILECSQCNKTFKTKSAFVAHEVLHTGERPHKCDFCNRAFSFKTNLIRHRKIHTGEKGHQCHHCDKAFIEKKCLVLHLLRHHPDDPGNDDKSEHRCNTCDKVFFSSAALSAHSLMHGEGNPFKCEVCNRIFTTSMNLARHLRKHTGERPFKCDICGKGFAEKRCVAVHRRLHTGEKPFSCEICGKSFTQASTLHSHRVVHTAERAFSCEKCGATFLRRSHYSYHMMKHNTEPSLQCQHCDMKFYRTGELKRHMLKHTSERPYLCTVCPKSFTRLQYLREHLDEHTGLRPFQCKYCPQTFSDSSSCYKHTRSHIKARNGDVTRGHSAAVEHNYGITQPCDQVITSDGVIAVMQNENTEGQNITFLQTVVTNAVDGGSEVDSGVHTVQNGNFVQDSFSTTPTLSKGNGEEGNNKAELQAHYVVHDGQQLMEVSNSGDLTESMNEQEITLEEAIEKGYVVMAANGDTQDDAILLKYCQDPNTEDAVTVNTTGSTEWQMLPSTTTKQEDTKMTQNSSQFVGQLAHHSSPDQHAYVYVSKAHQPIAKDSDQSQLVIVMQQPLNTSPISSSSSESVPQQIILTNNIVMETKQGEELPVGCQLDLSVSSDQHPKETVADQCGVIDQFQLVSSDTKCPVEMNEYLTLSEETAPYMASEFCEQTQLSTADNIESYS